MIPLDTKPGTRVRGAPDSIFSGGKGRIGGSAEIALTKETVFILHLERPDGGSAAYMCYPVELDLAESGLADPNLMKCYSNKTPRGFSIEVGSQLPGEPTKSAICPCGITRADCTYHA